MHVIIAMKNDVLSSLLQMNENGSLKMSPTWIQTKSDIVKCIKYFMVQAVAQQVPHVEIINVSQKSEAMQEE